LSPAPPACPRCQRPEHGVGIKKKYQLKQKPLLYLLRPHATIHLSSLCPYATIHVSSLRPHATIHVSSYYHTTTIYLLHIWRAHSTICVFILQFMLVQVVQFLVRASHHCLQLASRYICVLILLHMCPGCAVSGGCGAHSAHESEQDRGGYALAPWPQVLNTT
jgi:hypothetical protein